MKPILFSFFIALFLSALPAHAQTFAPAGSEWYHTMPYGVFRSYYDGDTIIAGRACRKVANKAYTADPEYSQGLRVLDHPTLYVYDNTDTVFVYNSFFSRFTPLYVFNITDGDVVTLPIVPLDYGTLQFVSNDSTFSFRVDSVRTTMFDTSMLRTVYTTSLGDPATNYVYRYVSFLGIQGIYAQRLGSIGGGLLPRAEPASYILSDQVQESGSLACYSDPVGSVKLQPGQCNIPSVQIKTTTRTIPTIYPNPAGEQITVSGLSMGDRVTLTDVTGRNVAAYTADVETLILPITSLQAGLYILLVTQADGSVMHRQLTVVR